MLDKPKNDTTFGRIEPQRGPSYPLDALIALQKALEGGIDPDEPQPMRVEPPSEPKSRPAQPEHAIADIFSRLILRLRRPFTRVVRAVKRPASRVSSAG